MANFCLLPSEVSKFKDAIVKGKLNPDELSNLSSAERLAKMSDVVGEANAKSVNALFESKMLLKQKKYGYTTWAKNVMGLKPAAKRDLLSKIDRMDERILTPQGEEQFLNDLAAARLGFDVTSEEAKNIAKMSNKISELRDAIPDKSAPGSAERLAYGEAVHDLTQYTGELKNPSYTLKETVTSPVGTGKRMVESLKQDPYKSITTPFGLAKAMKATLDVSALGRQGWKELWNNPTLWGKNAVKSFGDLGRGLKNKDVMKAIDADVFSRANYLNDRYRKMGLDVATIEEAYPSDIPEKIPIFKRLYKASEGSYTGFLHRLRADMADKYLNLAKKQGQNIDDPEFLKGMGKFVNSMTGRGNIKVLTPTGKDVTNVLFFSPRAMKSNLDILKLGQQTGMNKFVRQEAAKSALKVILGTAGVLGTAAAMWPGSVEFDPRSADFGKIKIGDTRFDVTAGMGGILTLAARIASQQTKSTASGEVKPLGNKYGQTSAWDVVQNYFDNKLSPGASVVKDLIKQQDFNGNKPTLLGELNNMFTPLPIQNVQEAGANPNSAPLLLTALADAFGISANTYGIQKKDWSESTSKELTQLRQKLGDNEFQKANDMYNQEYDHWLKSHADEVKRLPNDEKQAMMQQGQEEIKKAVFNKYNFKYERSTEEKKSASEKAKATRAANKKK